ncbi:type II toxin-antitoxin system RelE/ParE family toxin [Synergistaceae bacterium OttesenSCG-928-I11]|nr:type II toxin-antitoxin system RelE/ParE family toxin [Synergistaceae bacterium OttesenSCG-928-I11]
MVNPWEITIAPIAEKRIDKIPNPDKRRILEAIHKLYAGLSGDLKPLKGRDEWRLRVGDWRILMAVDIEAQLILIKYVESRGDVYKK